MKFELRGDEIWYENRIVDAYPSKGEAMAVYNLLLAAYNDGVEYGREAAATEAMMDEEYNDKFR